MRWTSTLATAGLAELAAHFLSVGWGFMILVGGFCAVASLLRVTAAKVSTTETRVNGVVTQLGTTNTNVTAAQNTANSAQTTANGALPKSGGTITGNLEVQGTFTGDSSITGNAAAGVHGNLTVLGTINGANIPSSPPSSAPAPPTGTGGASMYAGNFYTGSGAATWAQNIANKVDQIISSLQSAGIYS